MLYRRQTTDDRPRTTDHRRQTTDHGATHARPNDLVRQFRRMAFGRGLPITKVSNSEFFFEHSIINNQFSSFMERGDCVSNHYGCVPNIVQLAAVEWSPNSMLLQPVTKKE